MAKERVGLLGRIGEAFGPTYGEQRQSLALKEDKRLSNLRDDTELTNYLQSNKIVDNKGNFVISNTEQGPQDTGFQNLLSKPQRPYALNIANATNSIGTYKTTDGKEAKGKVAGFVQNEDKTVSLIIQRPDGKFGPKTWFSSEDENDQVVKMTPGEFKDFMTQNYRAIDSRVKPNRGESESNQPQIDEIGVLTNEIDNDSNLSLEEKQSALLELTQLISPSVDKSAIDNTDLGIDKAKSTDGLSLPMATLDTSTPEAQKAGAFVNTLTPQSVLADSDIDTAVQGLSEGRFRNTWKAKWKQAQTNLDRNEKNRNKDLEKRDGKITTKTTRDDERYESEKERWETQKLDLINQVQENIKTDTASIENAQADEEQRKLSRKQAIEKQLDNPNLTEAKREELQKQYDSFDSKVKVTSSLENYEFTELPTSADDSEAFNTWFETNKNTLEKAGKDGDLVNKVKEVITKFGVESAEDINKIPFDTPEANNVSRLTMANVMAGNASVDKDGRVPNYSAQLAANMTIFDAYGTQARAQASFAQSTITWQNGLRESSRALGNEVVKSYSNIVDLLYPFDAEENKLGKPNDIRTMAPRIREELLKVESNPTTPKFTPDGKGGYKIEGGTKAGRDASKDLAGILFERLVQANGSSGPKDWFKDVFTRGGESPDLGQILDRVRYTKNSRGQIDEIFYVGAQGQTLDGSIEIGGLTGGFGQEGSYVRNLLLAYIAEDPRDIGKEIKK